jgi:outer membrane protein
MVLLYQNEAQLEAARNLQALALKQLEYLTGTAVQTVTDEDCSAAAASDEKIYTEKIAERPDLKAATELVLIASKQVTIAKADYWPGISLNGDYYTNETGKFAGVNWDVYISAELPLLPVVQTAGSVKAASAKSKEAELNLELAKRNALLDVRTAYEVFRSASANNSAYLLAFKSAEENYKLQEQDYKYNLLNNLDLLQAIQFLQGARRDYVHSVYETKRAYWRLMAAAGEDPDNINSND